MTWLNLIAVLCAASAWLVTRRAPRHRPVAVALSLCAALDIIRAALPLPARVDLALCLVAPCASLWAYSSVFMPWPYNLLRWPWRGEFYLWIAFVTVTGTLPRPDVWWLWALPAAYAITSTIALLDVTGWRMFDGRWTNTHRAAAMLLAGDMAGLILLCRREWISYQAGAVLALVTGYQVWWLWRSIDVRRIAD